MLHVASANHPTAAATVLWIRTVEAQVDGADDDAIAGGAAGAGALDPRWSIPLAYGALMLTGRGALDEAEALVAQGQRLHGDDPWFPYTRGMLALRRGHPEVAADWLEQAAALPGAPEVHQAAADALRDAAADAPRDR